MFLLHCTRGKFISVKYARFCCIFTTIRCVPRYARPFRIYQLLYLTMARMTQMDADFALSQSKKPEPDRAEILARFLALRDVSAVVAKYSDLDTSDHHASISNEAIAAALENANIWSLRQFRQQCGTMSSFMMLGLSALQTARSHDAFNPHAAKRLYSEYKSSEAKALRIIGI